MSLNCAIPGCLSTDSKILFKFPTNNQSVLHLWQEEIPVLDFKKLNLINSFICEKHFENDQFQVGRNFIKQLVLDAVPSLSKCVNFIDLESCRFCLQSLTDASKIVIHEGLRKNFEDLFHEKFNINENLPNFCCQKCSEQFKNFTFFKNRVAKVQRNLEQLLEEKNVNGIKKEFEEVNVLSNVDYFFIKAESEQGEEEEHEEDNIQIIKTSTSERKSIRKTPQDLSKIPATCKRDVKKQNCEKVLRCQVCNKSAGTKSELNSHIIENHVDSDIEDDSPKLYKDYKNHFKCEPCNKKTFADLSSLARHFAVFHSTDLKKKQKILEREKFRQDFLNLKTNCSICRKTVSNRYLKAHFQRYHQEDGGKYFECDYCGKKQYNKQEMGQHMQTNHMVSRKKLQCPHCDYSCFLVNFMKAHINSAHLNKGIMCEICGLTLGSRHKQKIHVRVWHTGEKPYKCKIEGCDLAFASSTRRSEHMNTQHSTETYDCSICENTYKSLIALSRHVANVHSEKRFQCSFEGCDLRFSKKGKMLVHLATHTGKKPWICMHCPHTNASKSGLKRHLRDVHMNLNIQCELCEYTTSRKETYRKHVMSKHRDIGESRFNELLIKIRNIPIPKTELDFDNGN